MNLKLILFFALLKFGLCSAQLSPVTIVLKNGDKLVGIGKIKSATFKYKTDADAKAQEFDFSKIESIELQKDDDSKGIYKFFQVKNTETYVAVEEIITGKNINLYTITSNRYMPGNSTMPSQSVTVSRYFLKRPSEDKLTDLGEYSPIMNNLKEKVMEYFSDCKSLIEKLEAREFKVREGLEKIVIYYNESCG